MVKRIFLGLFAAAVLVVCYLAYRNWNQTRAMLSGEVKNGPPQPGDAASAAASRPPAPGPSVRPSPEKPAATYPPSPPPTPPPAAPASVAGSVPAADTIAPEPPNGAAYAGSGRYQVYRQGNLTWRINTETGSACILFATNEEWRKPEVYRHGCGSSGVQ